jgi:hypothetical protein
MELKEKLRLRMDVKWRYPMNLAEFEAEYM